MMTPGNVARVGVVLVVCAAAVGSSTSTTGNNRQVVFTPTDCGKSLVACTFDNTGIAVGSTLDVQIMDRGSSTLATDLTLESSDESILKKTLIMPGMYALKGMSAGTVMLSVKGPGSSEPIDDLMVEVAPATKLGFRVVSDKTGLSLNVNDPADDEVWTVPTGQIVIFQVAPIDATNIQLMGRLNDVDMPYLRSSSTLDGMGAGMTDGGLVVKLLPGASPGEITFTLNQPTPLPSPLMLKVKVQAGS